MEIGKPRRVFEVEPTSEPVPSVVPDPVPEPVSEPLPAGEPALPASELAARRPVGR
jgi:hypothetical protein